MPGTMEKLLMFYGDIIHDGPSGLDVSRCTGKIIFVKDMVNRGFMDVKRCIQAEFGPETVGKNMVVEAFVIVGRVDGTPARWGLRRVNGDLSWGSYMRFASTPGNAMYRKPTVYVWFVDVGGEAGCSNAAGVFQSTTTTGAHTQTVETMERSHMREEGVAVPTMNSGIAYLYHATIRDMRRIREDVSEIALAREKRWSDGNISDDDDEGGDPSQPLAIRQRAEALSMERWTDSEIAHYRDDRDFTITGMRMIMETVLEILRTAPSFGHIASSRLISIYETAEGIIERWSCDRIDDIAFRPYDMAEVRSALPSEARPSLATSLDRETVTRQDSLQRSQYGASRPEHQFDSGAMEVDNPFPETSPAGGPRGQCSYDQGQGSDSDESTDEEECDGLD
ncbi:hypothetical protein ACQJBY_025491 [Aegilops geniculata]